jgi:hypothetical protein
MRNRRFSRSKYFLSALDDFAKLVTAWPSENCHEPIRNTKRAVSSHVEAALLDRFGSEPTMAT